MTNLKCYKVGDMFVSAENPEVAKLLYKVAKANSGGTKLITINDKMETKVFDISLEDNTQVFTVSGNSIEYSGRIVDGNSMRILGSAIDSATGIDKILEESKIAKAAQTRKEKISELSKKYDVLIEEFKSTIPVEYVYLFDKVMAEIGCGTKSNLVDVAATLKVDGVIIRQHHWFSILKWFESNVLKNQESLSIDDRMNDYQLRKAFITAASRIVKSGSHVANTLNRVDKTDVEWGEYAQSKPPENSSDSGFDWLKYAQDKKKAEL